MAQTLNASSLGWQLKRNEKRCDHVWYLYISFAAFHIFSFDRLMNWVNVKVDNTVLLSHTSLQVLKRKWQILSCIISCMILSLERLCRNAYPTYPHIKMNKCHTRTENKSLKLHSEIVLLTKTISLPSVWNVGCMFRSLHNQETISSFNSARLLWNEVTFFHWRPSIWITGCEWS